MDFLHQQLDKLMQKPEYRGVEIVTPESEFLDFADNNFEYELGLSALNRKVAGSKKKLMDLADAATTPEGTKALVAYAEKVLKAAGYSAHEVWSVVSAAKADAFDRSQGKTETKKTAKSAVFQKEAVTDVRDRLLMLRSLHEGTAAFDSMSVDDLKKLIDSMLKRISLGKDPKSGSLDDTAQKEIMVKVVQTMYAALGKRA